MDNSSATTETVPLLDVCAVAALMAVSDRFVRRLVLERRIPYIKVGYFVRFDVRDVQHWLEQNRMSVEAD